MLLPFFIRCEGIQHSFKDGVTVTVSEFVCVAVGLKVNVLVDV